MKHFWVVGMVNDCIYALSSGSLPSGVAVIRVSGANLQSKLSGFLLGTYPNRTEFLLRTIVDPLTGDVIDKGLVTAFIAPKSFTGEDGFEFHIHGGPAVVYRLLDCLGRIKGFRHADAGEFSKRAFENGKLDLTEIEGLSDLLAAETEEQRKLAVLQSNGSLRELLDEWRSQLIRGRALIEAELDFADEGDVPGSVSNQVWESISDLVTKIERFVDDGFKGEIIRSGFKVALMGLPNAGKSSLLNALAGRDIAIVSDEAGTTRDVLEVSTNIGGYRVVFYDTAGLRESESKVEREGIKRAIDAGSQADLILWLVESGAAVDQTLLPEGAVLVRTKSDLGFAADDPLSCSTVTPEGLDELIAYLSLKLSQMLSGGNSAQITRHHHRQELIKAAEHLNNSLADIRTDITLRSEDLRLAGECLGRITGRIDVEDLLDLIFSEFCIGK